jgi:hypothetical protein
VPIADIDTFDPAAVPTAETCSSAEMAGFVATFCAQTR